MGLGVGNQNRWNLQFHGVWNTICLDGVGKFKHAHCCQGPKLIRHLQVWNMSDSSSMPPSSPPAADDWHETLPQHGEFLYVQALNFLGLHMAKSVPPSVKQGAITALDVVPTSDLLIGDFDSKTKERTLKPSCTLIPIVFNMSLKSLYSNGCPFNSQHGTCERKSPKDQELLVHQSIAQVPRISCPIPFEAWNRDRIGFIQRSFQGPETWCYMIGGILLYSIL